ncbi:transposase [Agrobacterium genomosp. 3 str. CIP 111-78]|uniref:DDE-type integrase/transposase/recombinase n=1 Tax=Agrobacterium tumefaciens TaxID=358 RepID=A0AAE6BK64_AGRTU|nr:MULTISPECIES: Mu transposase C-terminal domain-containing protein [Agrobacterium tumefaciens complex]MCA2374501.1 transposase [Agrobacterium tomkonis CIP 111-78]QCL99933.1 DDE-type integrase/transposase/recombinase [Agrobacterium tumefaciens]
MTANVWFTAGELAKIAKERGLKSSVFPNSERGVRDRAKEEGWNDLPENLCRDRAAVGGGREYHLNVLPDIMHTVITGREIRAHQLAAQERERETARKKVAALPVTSLRFRQRQAMEARGEILLAIDRYIAMKGGWGRRKAILDFVQAQEEHAERNIAKEKVEAGEALTGRERVLLERVSLLADPDGFGLLEDTLRLANDRSGDKFRISRATIYEWFSARDAGGITALAPALTKTEEPISEEFSAFLKFYCKPSKLAATEALEDYKAENPSSTLTIEHVRYTLRHKLNDIEKNVGREGLLTLRSRMAYIQRSTENLFPTTIYTADGKTFDAEVENPFSKKPFKPEITSILDVATRRCVGFSIALKENVISVTEALRNACCDHGIPAIFYTDRGPGYKNKTFDGDVNGLMGRLSITKMHALPYNSQAKGIIERFNGTVWNPLARKLPTYLGAEMDKEAAKIAHKATRSDLKEFGSSRLLPSWDDFRAMCENAIAKYNDRPHDGLPRLRDERTGKYRHYSPNEFWALHVADGFEPVPVDDDLRDDLFRPYEIRVARRGLVEWNTNHYYHAALERYHGEEVMVGYDFSQARYVWVREIDREEGQPGPLICVADFTGNKTDYVPRTFQQAAEDARHKGRVKRNEAKRRDIDAEYIAPYLLEEAPIQPMPFIDITPEPVPAGPVLVIDNSETPSAASGAAETARRLTFATDEALAAWALENSEKLTANQVGVLRRCLQRQTTIELFRLSGIDVDALRNVIRAAA